MTFIQKQTGEIIDLEEAGIRTRDFIISSPNPIHHTESIDGGIGLIDYGTDYGERDIKLLLRTSTKNIPSFSLKRDEIYDLFFSDEHFYLIERRIYGKRWKVKVRDSFDIQQRSLFGNFEIDFIGLDGYSESRGSSIEIHENGISAADNLWGFGMGLITPDTSLIYKFNAEVAKTFRVYNAGNVKVNPFDHKLKITIKDIVGSTANFRMINLTNGTSLTFNKPMTNAQTLIYDGINVKLNSTNAFKDTDHQYIELSPGWNNLKIYFVDSAYIEFDYHYIYK